jgi:hypothetical protein
LNRPSLEKVVEAAAVSEDEGEWKVKTEVG